MDTSNNTQPVGSDPNPPPSNNSSWTMIFKSDNSSIQNYRYLTTLSFLLFTLIICAIVFGGVREEGIYADDYLWMKYQTLLTPAPYTNYIWIPLLTLQALFIHGSLFTFKSSPLVGYDALASPLTADDDRMKIYINCPIIHYSGMGAMSMFMVSSFDREYVLFAFLFATFATVICSKIILTQLAVLAEADERTGGGDGDEAKEEAGQDVSTIQKLHEYVALRLPFEMFGGYTVSLCFQYFNTWMHVFGLNPKALVITANTSIVALLLIAAYILWGLKQGNGRHLYGSAVSMVWFLVGIAIELQNPTQPIYNQFSDGQIMSTQIMAGLASTLLSSLMAVRMIKTIIKKNMWNCMGACQGNDSVDGEEDITTDYVHA